MSEKYTPDETELRDCYAASLHEHAGEDYTTAKADAERGIAKLKADALREAAEAFDARLSDGTGNGRAYNSYRVAELLKARAERIKEEA